jgi:hypothetical protein
MNHAQALRESSIAVDERREWIRVDDHILMEYRLTG